MPGGLHYCSRVPPASTAWSFTWPCHLCFSCEKVYILALDIVLAHQTCFLTWHVKGHDVYLVWAKAIETLCLLGCFPVLFSMQVERNVSYRGFSFSLEFRGPRMKRKWNRAHALHNWPPWPLSPDAPPIITSLHKAKTILRK